MANDFLAHQQSTPDMTVQVDPGSIFSGTTLTTVAAQNTSAFTAPVTNPRIDRIVADHGTGTIAVITGTEAVSPVPPAIPYGNVPVAQVALTTSTTSIVNADITDERVLNWLGLGAIAFTNVYNVKDFGAIGDGVADDTLPIQATIDYVGNLGGGIVYIPQGTYKVMPQQAMPALPTPAPDNAFAALTIKYSDIAIIGDGIGVSKLLFRGYGDVDPTTTWQLVHWDADYVGNEVFRGMGFYIYGPGGDPLSNIVFKNFEYDGNCYPGNTGDAVYPANTTTGDGWDISNKCIYMNGLTINAVTFDTISFHNWRGEIIYGGGGAGNGNMYLNNCQIYQTNGDGISVSLGIYAINNRIYECAAAASESNNFDMPCVWRNNYLADCGAAGLCFQTNFDSDAECEIRDNTFIRCGWGVLVNQESRPTLIDGNLFIDNPTEGSAGNGDISLVAGVGNDNRNYPVITGFTITNNRFEKREYAGSFAVNLDCQNATAPVTGRQYEVSNIEIAHNISSSSQDALAASKRYLYPIALNIGTAPAAYTQNITIHDNTFINPQRDISSGAIGSTNLSPMPLMWNNTCYGIDDFAASIATTDGSTTTLLNNAGIATVISLDSLSGVQRIFSDVSGSWKVPVLDPTNYRHGQYLVLGGSSPDGVMIPYQNAIFTCKQDRYLETDTYLVLKFDAFKNRFFEQEFIDSRQDPTSTVTVGHDLAFSGRNTLFLSLSSPDYFDTFSEIGDLAIVTVCDAVGNATIRNNSNIVLLDGVNLSMTQNQTIQFFRSANNKLIQIGDEMANRIASAFQPREQLSPNMTVAVDAGAVFDGTTLTEVAVQSTATITAPTTNPRIDRVVIDQATGVLSVVTGTPTSSPTPPAIPSGKVPVAQVLLQTSSTVIINAMITDERVLNLLGLGSAATHAAGDFLQVSNNLSDVANAGAARTNLDLGSMATQSATSVNITGGSITGITDLAVADGGTGTSSLAQYAVMLGNGTGAVQTVSGLGTSGQVLTSSGTGAAPTWGDIASGIGTPTVQVFTSSGTWTRPSGCRKVKVTVIGGGASGGHWDPGAICCGTDWGGGGGGAGGTAMKYIDVTSTSSASVTVGAGGAAATTNGANGNSGGTSSFSSFCSATGGSFGGGGVGSVPCHCIGGPGGGGGGGIGSSGDLNFTGGSGDLGVDGPYASTAKGGAATLGGQGGTLSAPNGVGPGAGGAGSNANVNTGAGAAGIVIVEEYY